MIPRILEPVRTSVHVLDASNPTNLDILILNPDVREIYSGPGVLTRRFEVRDNLTSPVVLKTSYRIRVKSVMPNKCRGFRGMRDESHRILIQLLEEKEWKIEIELSNVDQHGRIIGAFVDPDFQKVYQFECFTIRS